MKQRPATSDEPRAWAAFLSLSKLVARSSGLVALIGLSTTLRAQEVHIPLNDGWQFQQVGKEQWYSAEVPGVVQTDLLHHGLIHDFYQGSNIDSVQWIENEDWIYKRTIVANDALLEHGHLDLVFKGLDTFAEIYLNDSLLGRADNMFRTWEWPIKERLKPGVNELKVILRSPIKEGAKLREAYGIQLPHDNDPSGVSPYIRKAAYQFGWDFCPRLVTSGIWQGVELRGWSVARITDLLVKVVIDRGDTVVRCGLQITDMADSGLVAEVEFNGQLRRFEPLGGTAGTTVDLGGRGLKKWWPQSHGEPHRYLVQARLTLGGRVISVDSLQFGFRTIHLNRSADKDGSKFQFEVNGAPMAIRGCNLVPPSLLPSGMTDANWQKLVAAMSASGMNMVRVWAGGVYPPDAFFEACDSAGILVWQDLMFGNIPSCDGPYIAAVSGEVWDQCKRLRNHPCIALWCGNNELDVAWRNWGWQDRYNLHDRDSSIVAAGAVTFFDHWLAREVEAFTGQPYLGSSPVSNWGNAEGLKNGDLHYWGVWHGDSAFSSFKNNVGRFVSEYGFQSYPDSALLAKYNDPKDLYLGSPTMKRLQRSYKTDKPVWDAIKRELGKDPKTFGEFVKASQEVQAKAYRMAIEAHMAAQPHCMGTLFWQLNDCWPGPSWSLIDFEGNWKPGMYEVQRLYGR